MCSPPAAWQAPGPRVTMATPEMRQGDFRNLIAGNGRRYAIYDYELKTREDRAVSVKARSFFSSWR